MVNVLFRAAVERDSPSATPERTFSGDIVTNSRVQDTLPLKWCIQSEKPHMLPLSLTYEVLRAHSLTPSCVVLGHCVVFVDFLCCSTQVSQGKWCMWQLPLNFITLWPSKPSLPFFSVIHFLKKRLMGTVQVFHANSWSRFCKFSLPLLLNMWLICPRHFSSLYFHQSLQKTCLTCPSSCNIKGIHKKKVQS